MKNPKNIHGILIVDKPAGLSSHSVVVQVRQKLQVKAGHTGTLDPMATGVLPIVLGKATRLARYYQGSDKEYRACIQLGTETDTYDKEGTIISQGEVPALTDTEAEKFIQQFSGEQGQRPPVYSAIKVKGQRLYKTARRKEPVMPPLRKVHFYRITTIERTHDRWTLDIHCSSGTYIRSLAHDMGERLGCGAHLDSLRRTRSGLFSLDDSIQLEDISVQWEKGLIPLDSMLTEIPAFELTDEGAARVSHGNPISCDSELSGTFRLVFETHLLAIGEAEEGILKPKTVFCQG